MTPTAPERPPDAGRNLREYVVAIVHRRWWIVACLVLGAAVGAALAVRMADVYGVRTKIDIAKQRPFGVSTSAGTQFYSFGESYYESQLYYPTRYSLLSSTTYVDGLLRRRGEGADSTFPMWDWLTWPAYGDEPTSIDLDAGLGPPLWGDLPDAGPTRTRAAVAAFERLTGLTRQEFARRFAFRSYGPLTARRVDSPWRDPSDLRGLLANRVVVRPEKGTTLVEILLEGERVEALAPLLNLLVEDFAREQRTEGQRRLDREKQYWSARRRDLAGVASGTPSPDASRLGKANAALRDWTRREGTDQNALALRHRELDASLSKDRAAKEDLERRLARSRPDLDALAAIAPPPTTPAPATPAPPAVADGAAGGAEEAEAAAADARDLVAIESLQRVAADLDRRAKAPAPDDTTYHRLAFVTSDAGVAALAVQARGFEAGGAMDPARKARVQLAAAVFDAARRRVETLLADLFERRDLRARIARNRKELGETWRLETELGEREQAVAKVTAELREVDEQLAAVTSAESAEKDLRPLKVIESARDPGAPVRPNRPLLLVLGAGLGLLFGVSLALFLDWLDDTVRDPREAERLAGAPVLGAIGTLASSAPGAADRLVLDQPRSPGAEAFRAVRTGLEFVGDGEGSRVLLVTSCGPQEGKTTVALNLATVLAQDGKRTLLVDADLRKPRIHRTFAVEGRVGLTNVLAGRAALDTAIVPSGLEHLDVLPCGAIPPNPAELLGRPAARDLFAELRSRYDRVVVDTPPVGVVTDAAVLARQANQVLLVVAAARSRRRAVEHGAAVLRSVGAPPAGVIVNQVRRGAGLAYGGYYYGRGDYGEVGGSEGA